MTLQDINEDGSWWHCIDCEVEFSLSRQELIDKGIILHTAEATISKLSVQKMGTKLHNLLKIKTIRNFLKNRTYINLKSGISHDNNILFEFKNLENKETSLYKYWFENNNITEL